MIPTVGFGPGERPGGAPDLDTLLIASELFRVHGWVLLEDVYPADLMSTLSSTYTERCSHYFQAKEFPDTLTVGSRRLMTPIEFRPPFNDPAVYASPLLLPIACSARTVSWAASAPWYRCLAPLTNTSIGTIRRCLDRPSTVSSRVSRSP